MAILSPLPKDMPVLTRFSAFWNNLGLSLTLPVLIGVPAILMTLAVGTATLWQGRALLQHERQMSFEGLASDRQTVLTNWLNKIDSDVIEIARSATVQDAIGGFRTSWRVMDTDQKAYLQQHYIDENPFPAGQKDNFDRADDSSGWSIVHGAQHVGLRSLQRTGGYYDFFLIDLDGNILYTVFKERDLGENLVTGPLATSGLGEVFATAKALNDGEITYSDFAAYAPSHGAAAGFAAVPVFSRRGERIGVFAVQIPIDQIQTAQSMSTVAGETGLFYLIGPDGGLRSAPRFEGAPDLLQDVSQYPIAEMVRNGRSEFVTSITGLRGTRAVAMVQTFDYRGHNWGLVVEQEQSEALRDENALVRQTWLVILGAGFLMALLSFAIARRLSGRVVGLSGAIRSIAAGNYATDVPQKSRGDELGQIAVALDGFQTRLGEAQHLAEERTRVQAAQQSAIETLGAALHRLSEGNLADSVEWTPNSEFSALFEAFARTNAELSGTLHKLIERANEIDAGANTLRDAAGQLSNRTETQAATLEETAAAVEEISRNVRAAAERSREVASIITDAQKSVESGGTVTEQAISAMVQIETSSNTISSIIGVIEDIAFQTNLLALNAGVEAARAGDTGRGFAVVASEVRALAQRTSDSAKEVRALISQNVADVANGASLVTEAGSAIRSVREIVTKGAGLVAEIASSAEETSIAVNEINLGMGQLDQVTQKNAAMVLDVARTGQNLSGQSSDLRDLVSRFRLEPARASRMARVA